MYTYVFVNQCIRFHYNTRRLIIGSIYNPNQSKCVHYSASPLSARMNIFKKDGVRIDFSSRLNRFSISQNTEWISLSPTTFHLLLCLLQTDSNYERVRIQQNGSEVEILKLNENYLLTFSSRSINSSINLKKSILESISTNYDRNTIKKNKILSAYHITYSSKKKETQHNFKRRGNRKRSEIEYRRH